MRSRSWRRRTMLMTLAAALVATSAAAPAAAAPAAATALYVVVTTDAPLATHATTKPPPGRRLDLRSRAATDHRAHLAAQRAKLLRAAGVTPVREYDTALSGFAARLTDTQVATLRGQPGVSQVVRNETREATTIETPDFLKLTGATGVWSTQFGGPAAAGEGVIVGVVDTGVWPEHAAFAALPEPRPDAATIAAKWHGRCDAGTGPYPVRCNNKLIGARFYDAGHTAASSEYLSPRDRDGHGTHTASTAAGNYGVPATVGNTVVGNASGMAPAARLAVYKALWENPDGRTLGQVVDLVAAVDDAVADGVDVINYSVSGSRNEVADPVHLAFLNAASAGVFVAASAGNDGERGGGTVAHNAPWVTTVGAGTHEPGYAKKVRLGNGVVVTGVGRGPAIAAAPLVDATAAARPGVSALSASRCQSNTLDPALVAGRVVLCAAGGFTSTAGKSWAVWDLGGVGMVLVNPGSTGHAGYNFVPTVEIGQGDEQAVRTYAATAGATARLLAGVEVRARNPQVADFSSRGPAQAAGGDLLKPDILAPGVNVVGAVPQSAGPARYTVLSGTSMAAPHIAGLGALLIGKHPQWSPMAVKSALMTTATPIDSEQLPIEREGAPATPFEFGAGQVRVGRAFDPGLVYDSGPADWSRFLCGQGSAACGDRIDASDLNLPSIAIGDLVGAQVVTRTVTNLADHAVQYNAKIEAPPGIAVTTIPSRLSIPAFGTAQYSVRFTRTTAPLGVSAFGALTWVEFQPVGPQHQVRSPLAVRPVAASVPDSVVAFGTSGSTTIAVRPGYTGTLTATVGGLIPSTVRQAHVDGARPDFVTWDPWLSPGVTVVHLEPGPGNPVIRFRTTAADHPAGTNLDLYVYRRYTNDVVAMSAGPTSEEVVTVPNGQYDLYIVAAALRPGAAGVDVRYHEWVVDSPVDSPAGNLTAAPATQPTVTGAVSLVEARWTGLTPGGRYVGVVRFGDGTGELGRTVLEVGV